MRNALVALLFGALPVLALGCEDELPPPAFPTPEPPTWAEPAAVAPPEAPPLGRLPADVEPLHYALSLDVDPAKDRFSGIAEIAVDVLEPRDVIWLHARGLEPKRASLLLDHEPAPVEAKWEVADASAGVVALRLPRTVGPGKVTIHVEYDAPFMTQPEGLFVVTAAGKRYVFSDLEPSDARRIFPSFDEPERKTPFDLSVVIPKGARAVANAHEVSRAPEQATTERVIFATTARLPTYLFELAVGPFDVVDAPPVPPNGARKRPLPLRGVATAGRGPELAYALAHAGEILGALEGYFGIEYPFDKLDLIAVPNLPGAMENAGAVTFREWLLLVDPKTATIEQRRAYDGVVAHELAHQWFGDLVTMRWWDDIWLNEAFATWMGTRTVKAVRPENRAEVSLLEGIHGAMGTDALASARAIRQTIVDQNDVVNAFDDITYRKGGGVLSMFERWLGPDTFQRGIRAYLESHRGRTGTTEDLLAALSVAASRDVVTPMQTFLDQPGVPFVEAHLACDEKTHEHALALHQSRFFPLGSKGDPKHLWQIPVCARYPVGKEVRESCTLLTSVDGKLPFEGGACPPWAMPNADGAGYYRWSLPGAELAKLREAGWAKLSVKERMSVVNSLQAAFSKGTTPADVIFRELAPLAREGDPAIAGAPMDFVRTARDWLWEGPERAAIEAYGRTLYGRAYHELGWGHTMGAKTAETPERELLRQKVIRFLAFTARDPEVRKEAAKRGRAYVGFGGDGAIHPEAVDPNLAAVALAVAVQEGGADLFDALEKRLGASEDSVLRGRLLEALGAAFSPELAARARKLALSPGLLTPEVMAPLWAQLDMRETRDDTWTWLGQNLDALVARLPAGRSGWLPWTAARFCDEEHAKAAEVLFLPRLTKLEGGPRNLAGALEGIHLCVARKAAHEEATRRFFGGKALSSSASDARNITPSKL